MSALGIIGMLAPARISEGVRVSKTIIIIVVLIAVFAGLAIMGWRAPDRSPGADKQRDRERIDH